jgi:hypothetical protein
MRGRALSHPTFHLDEIDGFGGATIVRDLHVRYEIQGGTECERKQAHDWMLQFMWPADQPKPQRWPGIIL